ncbi:Tail completion protein [uncultured Caudovirales phage]|uniref:Tail completion protein n=1 Tax=uncultured Caudovirales phage TaxID=2100421 RepID=A0A6J5QIK6_9CAUD|nr:Tail completion protein [uncultured Caudovirales phage]
MADNGPPESWLFHAIESAGVPAFPTTPPELQAAPFVVFSRDSTDWDLDFADGTTGAVVSQFSVEVFTDGYLDGKTLATAVRAAVGNFSGVAYGATIDRVQVVDERDGPPVLLNGRNTPTYVVEQSYQIFWNE